MKVIPTNLDDCVIIEPDVFYDDRGFFLETFQMERLQEMAGIKHSFVQDNHSRSTKGVLRGLHFQQNNSQGKLVRVARGSVLDIAVDLRSQSNTFGQVAAVELSDSNFHQLWVPPGFAHGFLVLSEVADFQYKCTEYYDRDDEQSIHWQDPDLAIPWPTDIEIIISTRDAKAQSFQEYCTKNL
jgi:dTDP-4-dehydrorhamnose 3,5-epimerase